MLDPTNDEHTSQFLADLFGTDPNVASMQHIDPHTPDEHTSQFLADLFGVNKENQQ